MPDAPGPYRTIPQGDGTAVPWYMVEFDRKGRTKAAETRAALLAEAGAGGYTDVFVFCHGWNNSWDDAVANYEAFIAGYQGLLVEQGLTLSRPYRPLLVGIYWPSAILVTADEAGSSSVRRPATRRSPRPNARPSRSWPPNSPPTPPAASGNWPGGRRWTAMRRRSWPSCCSRCSRRTTTSSRCRPLRPTSWSSLWSDGQGLTGRPRPGPGRPAAGHGVAHEGPGRTGRRAMGSTLCSPTCWRRLPTPGSTWWATRSAAGRCWPRSAPRPLPRPVNSLLLLQGAINHLCFAVDPAGKGRPGGFRPALDRVEVPVLATFSHKDQSLTRFFHLALRRSADLGEVRPGGRLPEPLYAALGGYGPGGCGEECEQIEVHARWASRTAWPHPTAAVRHRRHGGHLQPRRRQQPGHVVGALVPGLGLLIGAVHPQGSRRVQPR